MPPLERAELRSLLCTMSNWARRLDRREPDPNSVYEFASLVSQVNAKNLEVDLSLAQQARSLFRKPAPLLYADVYVDSRLTSSIFGFRKAGGIIPLHNHPRMNGFIRVICGSVKIATFSFVDHSASLKFPTTRVRFEGEKIVSKDDYAISLGPVQDNFHEITALEDGSFFFDVLVPGYEGNDCKFFSPQKSISNLRVGEITELSEIFISDYNCDQFQYEPISLLDPQSGDYNY